MCLIMTAQFSKAVGDRLTDVTGGAPLLQTYEQKNWLRRPTGMIFLSEVGKGCACSMLTEAADWGQPYWKIRPEVRPLIAYTVERLASSIKEPFVFKTLWVNDRPKQSMTVTVAELAELIRADMIGQKTKYNVIIDKQ